MHSFECIFLLKYYNITIPVYFPYSVTVTFATKNNIRSFNKRFTAFLLSIFRVTVCNITIKAEYMRPLCVATLVSIFVI